MPHVATYLRLAGASETTLAASLRTVGQHQRLHADIFHTCETLAKMSDSHIAALSPINHRYQKVGAGDLPEPDRLLATGLSEVRTGQIGMLRDLQDLQLLATLVQSTWTVLSQAAQGLRDQELLAVATTSNRETSRQLSWLNTRMKTAAPQALIVAP